MTGVSSTPTVAPQPASFEVASPPVEKGARALILDARKAVVRAQQFGVREQLAVNLGAFEPVRDGFSPSYGETQLAAVRAKVLELQSAGVREPKLGLVPLFPGLFRETGSGPCAP